MSARQSSRISSRLFSQVNLAIFTMFMICFMAVSVPEASAGKIPITATINSMVNINSATSEQLAQALSGVGTKKAQAIVAYREANGKFKKIDDLVKVKGIGPSTLEKNRRFIRI